MLNMQKTSKHVPRISQIDESEVMTGFTFLVQSMS